MVDCLDLLTLSFPAPSCNLVFPTHQNCGHGIRTLRAVAVS
jgi:hypothetical protein